MTRPAQGADPAPQGPPNLSGRAELARVWAKALSTTAYVPRSRRDIERLLRSLLDDLFDSICGKKFTPGPAREVGVRLVAENFIGEQSLSRTVEVLGQALPVQPELRDVDRLTSKVVSLLGALSAGFAAALRARTLDQQEQVKRALLRARQNAERGLRVSEARFRELFTSSTTGIAISDLAGRIVEANPALGEIIGAPGAELVGCSVYDLLHPDDVRSLTNAYQALRTGKRTRFRLPQQLRLVGEDGEPAWAYLAVSLLHDAEGTPTHQVLTVEDVTELHLLGERLRHQSLHDVLTGLPNQQFFVTSLERVFAGNTPITLCMIDLDDLAVINDGFGRGVGDQLLRSVVGRLQSVVAAERAMVARFGADRFAILIENTPATPDVATLAARINAELAEPVYIEDHGLAVTCSIGVATRQGENIEPADLVRAAEAALHAVTSKRQWALFDPQHDAEHRTRCRLAAGIPGAWESGEISLDYQPVARLADQTVVAVQALLRWNHPRRGSLRHQECLDLAARTGLVLSLGQWMLPGACDQLADWQRRRGGPMPVLHLDLTPQHALDQDLVAGVRGALEHAGLRAHCLQLGIPGSVLDAEQGAVARENLQVLAEMGVAIALLGCSGADAVAHLEDLPAQTVVLAPGMVRRVASRGADSAVARSVAPLVGLLHCCGATVVVRGIDTQDQADWWRSAGADVGQGGFFAPPGSPDIVAALLDLP